MLKTNKEEAAKLWAEGLKEIGKDSVELELLNYDGDSAKKMGEYLKEQMETTLKGLTLSLNQQPFQNKLDIQAKGDFDISYSGWGPDYKDPMTFLDMFTTGNGNNHTAYSSKDYDKLIKDASTTLLDDLEARDKAMADAEKLLIEEDAVIAPLYQRGASFLMKDKVKGLLSHSFGGDYSYKWVSIEE